MPLQPCPAAASDRVPLSAGLYEYAPRGDQSVTEEAGKDAEETRAQEDSPAAVDATVNVTSPVSGVSEAITAGASFLVTATNWRARKLRRGVKIELPAYLGVQCSWFMAFGLQLVLFPYLITGRNHLHLDGLALGLANMALSAPSVVFLLIGGVVAERADGRRLLILLHLLASVPSLFLAVAVSRGELTYPAMIFYALAIGTIGAFMMPARDAIVNEVVERRMRVGSSVTLQLGVTLATWRSSSPRSEGSSSLDMPTRRPVCPSGLGVSRSGRFRPAPC